MGLFEDLIPAQGGDFPMGPNGIPRVEISKPAASAPKQDPFGYAYRFFTDRGYSPAQAAGIVGGLRGETNNLNTTQVHDGGMGFGIAGWNGDRLKNLVDTYGATADSLPSQLDFIDKELKSSEGGAYSRLQRAQTPEQAGSAMLAYFRPAGWSQPGAHKERASYARQFFDAVGSAVGPSQANAAEQPNQFSDLIPAQSKGSMFDDLVPKAAPQAPSKGVMGYVDDAVRSLAQGATFGYADELAALGNSITGNGSYAENLAAEKKRNEQIPAAISIPGEIAGAIGGAVATSPLTAAASAASGISRLPGYAQTILGGGAAGALYGSGSADPGHRIEGAVQGAGVGAGAAGLSIPLAAGAQRLAQPIADLIRGARDPEGEAARRVVTGLQRDMQSGNQGLSPADYVGAVKNGQPVAIMDIGGETTRALARDAANKNPEARAVLNKAIDDRYEAQSGRLTDWLNKSFNYPNAHAQQEAIDNLARTANKPAYAKAYAEGDKAIWSPELERLTSAPYVESALSSAQSKWKNWQVRDGYGAANPPFKVENGSIVRTGGNGMRVFPNLQMWDYAARELQDSARAAPIGSQQAKLYNDLARQLKDELDKIVPSYGTARSGAARFFGAENALEAGQNYVTQNFASGETRAALAKMSPEERKLFQDGFVSRLTETLNNVPDRRNVVNQIAQSPAAREKLAIALGPQKAKEFEAFMHVESVMDQARGAVQGNSTTARQLIEAGLAGAGGYGVATGDYNPKSLLTAAFVGGALRGAGQKVAQRIDQNVAKHLADLLTSNDISKLNRGIQIIANRPVFLQALRNANAAGVVPLTAAGASQAGRMIPTPQLPAMGRADEQGVPRPPGQ